MIAPRLIGAIGLPALAVLAAAPWIPRDEKARSTVSFSYSVSVTPDGGPHGGTAPVRPDNSGPYTATFTVNNTGTLDDTYEITDRSTGSVAAGTVSPHFLTVPAGQSGQATANYSSGAAGTGTIVLQALDQSSDTGYVTVPVVHYAVSVTPDSSLTTERLRNTTGFSESYTVTNTSSDTEAFTLTCSATGLTCGTVTPSSVTLASNGATGVTVAYSTGELGTAKLVLKASNANASDTGYFLLPIVKYVQVTPRGGNTAARPNSTGNVATFTVTNVSSHTLTYNFTCTGAGATCTGSPSPGSLTLDPGGAAQVTTTYSTGVSGSESLSLIATDLTYSGRDTGSYGVSVFPIGSDVTVTPLVGSQAALSPSTANVASFTVANSSGGSALIGALCTAPVTNCKADVTTVASGPAKTVNVHFDVESSTGNGSVGLKAVAPDSTGVGTTTVTTSAHAFATVNQGLGDRWDKTGCVTGGAGPAAAFYCGELLVMQPLVGYRSLNRPRLPTLVYTSRAATGGAEVLLDISLPGGGAATPNQVVAKLWLDGTAHDSVFEKTLPAGWDAGWAGGGTRRVAIPVAPGLVGGVHDGKVEIRRVFTSTTLTDTIPISVVIAKRDNSPFGAGWWLGGVDRAYPNNTATIVTFIEPEGSGVVFRKVGSTWQAPAGETSSLTTETWCGQSPCRTVYKRTYKNQTASRYDAGNGRLLSDTSPVGTRGMFYWSANAIDTVRLDSIVDAAGKVVRFSYNGSGQVTTIQVPGALATTAYIGATGNLDSIADPDGVKTKFWYTAGRHRMSSRNGRRSGENSSYVYVAAKDTVGVLATIGTPDGTLSPTAYQREGLPATGTGTSAAPAIPGFPANAVVTLRDLRSIATRINVDRLGRPLRIAGADSGIVTIARDSATSLPTEIDWTPTYRTVKLYWNFTSLDLDSTAETADSGVLVGAAGQSAVTHYQYQPTFHNLTQVTTPLGLLTKYEYDATTDVLLREIAPSNDTTTFTYNTRGQVVKIKQFGHDSTTDYGYDAASGNLIWAMSPHGHEATSQDWRDSIRYVYDTSGTLVTQDTAPQLTGTKAVTKYFYDAVHRDTLVQTWGASGETRQVLVQYLNAERTVTYTIPSASSFTGRTVTNSLDAMGRVASLCTPAMAPNCHQYSFSYGLLSSMNVATDGTNAFSLRYWVYDSLSRVQQFVFSAPSGSTQYSGDAAYTDTNTFRYNTVGQITRGENTRALIWRSWYPSGRLACEHQIIKRWATLDTTSATNFAIQYFYDRDGRLVHKVLGTGLGYTPPAPGLQDTPYHCAIGGAVADVFYHYDTRGRVDSIRGVNLEKDSTIRFRIAYDAASRQSALTNNRNKWTETWTYNQDDLPYSHVWYDSNYTIDGNLAGAYAVQDTFLVRDDAARILTRWGQGGWYRYDAIGQVDTAPSETFTYDSYGAGEMSAANHSNGTLIDTFTRDAATGQLTTASIGNVSGAIPHTYFYDRAGNRLRDSIAQNAGAYPRVTRSSYDGAGRTVAMRLDSLYNGQFIQSTHLWTYWYDPLGRRILVADSTPTLNKPAQQLLYDGDNVVLRGERFWSVQAGLDRTPVVLQGTATEAFLSDGVDHPLYSATTLLGIGCSNAGSNNALEYFYHADELGSVKRVTFGNGQYCFAAGYGYQAYGTGGSTPTDSRPGYTGAPSDASGLVFLRNRAYDPNTGTFTQPDPIGLAGGLNLYGYVGNDPVSLSDPFGLCGKDIKKDEVKEKCRDATPEEGQKYADAAEARVAANQKDGVTYPADLLNPGSKEEDCSHFCSRAGQDGGLSHIPYHTTAQLADSKYYRAVSASEARAGDVMWQPGHMGVYLGRQDDRGRPLGAEMGNSGAHIAPWGPDGWFAGGNQLTYYRPLLPK